MIDDRRGDDYINRLKGKRRLTLSSSIGCWATGNCIDRNPKHWDDKPRWAPDGKTLYFVSGRGGFFNVFGIRFDPAKGKAIGDPFRVTSFESPALMVPKYIYPVELSLTQDKLVLTMEKRSGSIWVLDNVDR